LAAGRRHFKEAPMTRLERWATRLFWAALAVIVAVGGYASVALLLEVFR
jgi:hypothetical protein